MTRRILVALDDSPASLRAAEFAHEMFGDAPCEVLAISVAPRPTPWIAADVTFGATYPYLAPAIPELDEELENAARETLESSGVEADLQLAEVGDPVEAIRQAAIDHRVSLIVVGSHHRGLLSRLIHGSVADDLVHEAPCPVLVVGPERSDRPVDDAG